MHVYLEGSMRVYYVQWSLLRHKFVHNMALPANYFKKLKEEIFRGYWILQSLLLPCWKFPSVLPYHTESPRKGPAVPVASFTNTKRAHKQKEQKSQTTLMNSWNFWVFLILSHPAETSVTIAFQKHLKKWMHPLLCSANSECCKYH